MTYHTQNLKLEYQEQEEEFTFPKTTLTETTKKLGMKANEKSLYDHT